MRVRMKTTEKRAVQAKSLSNSHLPLFSSMKAAWVDTKIINMSEHKIFPRGEDGKDNQNTQNYTTDLSKT